MDAEKRIINDFLKQRGPMQQEPVSFNIDSIDVDDLLYIFLEYIKKRTTEVALFRPGEAQSLYWSKDIKNAPDGHVLFYAEDSNGRKGYFVGEVSKTKDLNGKDGYSHIYKPGEYWDYEPIAWCKIPEFNAVVK